MALQNLSAGLMHNFISFFIIINGLLLIASTYKDRIHETALFAISYIKSNQ